MINLFQFPWLPFLNCQLIHAKKSRPVNKNKRSAEITGWIPYDREIPF